MLKKMEGFESQQPVKEGPSAGLHSNLDSFQ